MRRHIAKPYYLRAKVAVRSPRTVDQFVLCKPRVEHLGRRVERVAFLTNFEMAELAQNNLAGAESSAMAREVGNRISRERTGWTLPLSMVDVVVLCFRDFRGAIRFIVGAMPMILPFF